MANKQTLDDTFEHLVDQIATRRVTDDDIADTKQKVLQWVADEVVGKNILVVDVTLKENYVKKDAKNNLKEEQRQILKAHGWKEN